MNFNKKIKPGKVKISNKERNNLLSYIKAIDKSGKDPNKAITNKIEEYTMRKKHKLKAQMEGVLDYTSRGGRLVEALYENNIINQQELYVLLNAKDGLASGIEKIIENSKNSGRFKFGIMMFLGPILAIAGALLAFHDPVKGIVIGVTEPMRSAGATPPPIPEYLVDPYMYIVTNIAIWTVLIGSIIFIQILKKKKPALYLKTIPILEEEFTLDVLKSLKTLMEGGGINLSDAANALTKGSTDPIKHDLYQSIVTRTKNGKQKLSDALSEFGINYNTISALKIGEDGNDIAAGIDIALEDLESRYKRDIGIYLRLCFWGGQLGMMFVAMKPMVDILMLMSVGQMNFEL